MNNRGRASDLAVEILNLLETAKLVHVGSDGRMEYKPHTPDSFRNILVDLIYNSFDILERQHRNMIVMFVSSLIKSAPVEYIDVMKSELLCGDE